MDLVRYRILGTTQALQSDGTPVPVGGARLRALLTVLALRRGRAVAVAALVDEVWADDPPADAPAALQALVGRLRRALGPDAIVSLNGGYRLAAAPDDIDLYRFARLADDGARALADGDPAGAAGLLDDALALWQGPPLADLPDRAAEAARWETRRLDAHRTRLTAALALGRAGSALPDLTALCDTHPLDEPLQTLRLRALRDTGRTAQALAAYEEVRRLLADRLGTRPGPALRALHEELLRADGPDPRTGRGKPRENPYDTAPGTLLGPGGAGKTRLSQEAGEAAAEAMPDGVWLAELAPVDDPANVPETVLTALGARETVLRGAGAEEMRVAADRKDNPLARLAEHCAGRRMLLILDNCEHVVDAAAHLVDQLLQRCPELTVLATSREPLGIPGELLRPVEPLTQPHALRLLADRGAAARPGFTVDADPEAAAEICRRLDGLPLAIELAAARLRMMTPRQIADRLDDRFRLLTSGSRTLLPRQQTLRAVVDWSWELLDEDERYVLRRLSVFAGGCDLAAAEAVCGPAALEALGSLVDKSLVVAAPSEGSAAEAGGEMRYRLLETVVEYAGERLDETGTRPAAERAHLTYYRELVRATDPLLRCAGQRAAIGLLELEYENIRTALRYAVAERDEQEALCLALSLCWYWQMRDLKSEARHWSAQVKELGPNPFTPPARPVPDLRERLVDQPPPMSPAVLDEARRGVHLVHLACMDMELPAWQTAEAQEKLRVISATYRPGQPQTCRFPGFMWFYAVLLTGDIDRLRSILDTNIDTCRSLGFTWELAQTLQLRANILANRSDWAGDALADADGALEIFDRLGDAWGAAEALSARGESLERRGEFALAAADYERAIEYAERLGTNAQLGVLGVRLGGAYIESGDPERGEKMLFDVLESGRGRRTAAREAVPIARLYLAARLGRTGRTTEAREQLTLLRQDFHAADYVLFAGYVIGVEGWLEAVSGHHEEALRLMRRALERSLDRLSLTVAPYMPAVHLVTAALSVASVDGGDRAREAALLLGAADALLPSGHFSSPMEAEARAMAETVTRASLDDTAYDTAYAEGGALTLEEAVALV
ncbi:BTAD domain-containing putative transcriptional regulator [Streptomyces scabiei]|uniref:BTAD domain-containing putative transcriptional regulator n=1 Tax=Streptomyces scabiei TaxID=1930 RepID=UPI0029BA4D4A|nr:BTAD domain-containing putative transcriptional regulator [Streptomyces scabiei]MDX2807082.1 BTAD domain-containing putative transcriptional regulator [Streptomyces scabiei]